MTPRVLVIVPTYNEAENLELVLAEIAASMPDASVLVVDDSSPDGTGALADRLAATDPRVSVLHREGARGLGTAYLAGFAWALERDVDVVVEMDADGSHPAASLPRLIAAVQADARAGAAIGSRWVPGGSVLGWPAHRQLLSRAGNGYVRLALGLPVRDATAGFRAYSAEALRSIDLEGVHSRGYCFQVDLTLRTLDAGYAVVETPIAFSERRAGRSKMSPSIVVEAMARVTVWALKRRLLRRRRFAPSPRA